MAANTIVVTDGYTLNPGDLTWEKFQTLGTFRYFDRTSTLEVYERCLKANVIVTNKTPLTQDLLTALPGLKVIAVSATGFNVVDIAAAKKRGILVCNVPGYGTDSVAQHTFSLILELVNHVGLNHRSVVEGEWQRCPDFCYTKAPMTELSGKTIGIVGYGAIGRKVAAIAQAFGMNVLYTRHHRDDASATIEEVFSLSDVVSLHCPLTKDNSGFVNEKLLSRMKPGALLINTSRGQLINETDLYRVLKEGSIGGAGLDVLSVEPPSKGNLLIGLPNCIVTPHNAWYSREARQRIMDVTYNNIVQALNGTPVNVVNG
jgi:glycerate dehydrogenase